MPDLISSSMADTVRLHALNITADDALARARTMPDGEERDDLLREALAARCRMLELGGGND